MQCVAGYPAMDGPRDRDTSPLPLISGRELDMVSQSINLTGHTVHTLTCIHKRKLQKNKIPGNCVPKNMLLLIRKLHMCVAKFKGENPNHIMQSIHCLVPEYRFIGYNCGWFGLL